MGMDVYGKAPKSERGEYFRNNVWWWRPLWDYVITVAPDLTEGVNGHYNDGDGLNAEGAEKLSQILMISLSDGTCEAYEKRYYEEMAELPNDPCIICQSTGIRTDAVGQEGGQPTKELPEDKAIILGRTHGWCNGCDGLGWRPNWQTSYPFKQQNVREFAEFLAESGGFEIC
jgi:hypothetical protein